MGNKNPKPLPLYEDKPYTLEQFKNETPRKMTLHILSKNKNSCISFVKILTGEKKIFKKSDELLEKDINKKINLFSFMNYKIYDSADIMMNILIDKVESEEKSEFSEVVIILPNEDINSQIIKIKEKMNDSDTLNIDPYYNPFFIFCSPNNVDLNGFISSKTFYYKIMNEGSLNIKINQIIDIKKKENENEKESKNIDFNDSYKLYNELNRLFSYYNELGDNFSFINSDGKEVNIELENVNDITVFINILMVGRTGSGKSTLINLLLDEKKSLEGGSGLSTTSKDIKVYTKTNVPLRLYDAKGFEDEKTVQNFINIFDNFYGKLSATKDSINAVFYCMDYKKNGTIVDELEFPIYQKLVELRIPILFIITKCQFIPEKESNDEVEKSEENDTNIIEDDNNNKIKKARKNQINKIKNTIKKIIKKSFNNINKKEDADKFIKDYVKFYFVNLVKTKTSGLKPFGLDKVLSFFTKNVTQEDWQDLKKSCKKCDEENCKKYCKNNPFLKVYSEFNELNARNKTESLRYLKGLKAGAFFSGWVPGVDIGMEYYYRYLFEKKLKQLYGFNYEEAKHSATKNNSEIELVNNRTPRGYSMQMDNINNNSIIDQIDNRNNSEIINYSTLYLENTKKQEKKIDKQIYKGVSNKLRNVNSFTSTIGQTSELIVGISGEIILEAGAQVACFALLPITCIVFGALSCYNIHKDCKTMLNIYEKAFTPLKFKTLLSYIQSFQEAIKYLKKISKKFAQDKNDDRN